MKELTKPFYTQNMLLDYLQKNGLSISRERFIKLKRSGVIPQPDMRLGSSKNSGVLFYKETVEKIIDIIKERYKKYRSK